MYRTLTLSYIIIHFKIHFNPRLFTEHKSYLQHKKFSKIFGQKFFLLQNMFYNFSLTLKSIPKKFSKIFFRPLENCHLYKMSLLVFKCLKLEIAKVLFQLLLLLYSSLLLKMNSHFNLDFSKLLHFWFTYPPMLVHNSLTTQRFNSST